jgi:hypothetical protein
MENATPPIKRLREESHCKCNVHSICKRCATLGGCVAGQRSPSDAYRDVMRVHDLSCRKEKHVS